MYKKAGGKLSGVGISDQTIRDKILETQGNVIISASAGTGKTHTIIEKILSENKKNNTYKTYAAITFTRKAAKEIRDRIGRTVDYGFIGTNDNFVLKEVIQPFIRDVYGDSYDKNITPDYSNERVTDNYDELLKVIEDTEQGYICKYMDPKKNFGFELALNILKKSYVARRYLKSKYLRIYVDEYQDCDKDMHDFFVYIGERLKIPLFIVGDPKQSIYEWRGGYPKGFKQLTGDDEFTCFVLKHNFRSNMPIQNYSNIFMDDVRGYYTSCDISDEVQYIDCNGIDCKDVLYIIKSWYKQEKTIAFLVRSNRKGEEYAEYLTKQDIEMRYIPRSPLDDSELESTHVWVARCIATYLLQDGYNEYSFYNEIPMPESYDIKKIRKFLKKIQNNWKVKEDKFFECCRNLYVYLVDSIDEDKFKNEIDKLLETIDDPRYKVTYNQTLYKHVVTTVHSSKGLQYDQVIISSKDYFNFDEFDVQLHYVAVSRAKEKLLVLVTDLKYMNKLSKCIDKTKELLGVNINVNNLINKVSNEKI